MDAVYNVISRIFKIEHGISQEVPSSSLNGGLEDTATNQSISTPLPSVGVLGMDSNTHLLRAPWCGEQLELWPLPADQSTTG